MSVKNFYPEKQIVPFRVSLVEMFVIIGALKELPFSNEIKRAAYAVVRIETGNGKYVIGGTNFCGAQSDSGRWPAKWDVAIDSVCTHNENMTGKERGFIIFHNVHDGLAFLCERLEAKGIFIGNTAKMRYHKGAIATPTDLADAYEDEWVYGEDHNTTPAESKDFISMYNQAEKLFC